MNRRNIIIIAGVVIILIAGIASYLMLSKKAAPQVVSTLPSISDPNSPFGVAPGSGSGTGASGSNISSPGNLDNATSSYSATTTAAKFRILSVSDAGTMPVSGSIAFSAPLASKKATSSPEMIRFVERGTGHIYEMNIASSTATRLTATTIPKITEAIWAPDGSAAYLRYAKDGEPDIQTYYATFTASTTPGALVELQGGFLPVGISSISSNGANIFYIAASGGGASGIQSKPDGTKGIVIWNSPLSEWNASYLASGIVALQTKASKNAPGFLYFFNPKTQATQLEIASQYGLSTVASPDGLRVAYSSYAKTGQFVMNILNVKTGESQIAPITTLADKCIWSSIDKNFLICAVPVGSVGGNYPDDWYKGKISFTDEFWGYHLDTGTTQQIAAIADEPAPFDATNLQLSAQEDYLTFTNKTDSLLWSVRLK